MKNSFIHIPGLILLPSLVLFALISFGQEKIKPGKISIQDLQMKTCPFDSSAEAMVLGDIGKTHFIYDDQEGFIMIFERLVRIKIFTKEGYSWANREIFVYHDAKNEEKITTLKGRTYNLENGKITEDKLDNESIYTEKENSYYVNKKFTFPNVREGSVIELQYIIRSPFLSYVRSWQFQSKIPSRWSEYEIITPEFFRYSPLVTGYIPFTLDERKQIPAVINVQMNNLPNSEMYSSAAFTQNQVTYTDISYHLALENAPAFKEEPYTSSPSNFINGIRYEFTSYQFPNHAFQDVASSWDKVNESLLKDENFGVQLKKGEALKDIVNEIRGVTNVSEDQMLLAYNYVKNNFTWNGKNSVYVSEPVDEIFKTKAGNSADLNLILVLILRNLGMKANPVVLSTRQNGLLYETHPTLSDLNYVIAHVALNETEYRLDATNVSQPANMLPFKCLNGTGLLVNETGPRWITMLKEEKDNSLLNGDLKIDNTGKIKGDLKISSSGYEAVLTRNDYLANGKEQCEKDVRQQLKGWEVTGITIEKIKDINEPVITTCAVESEEKTEVNGDMIYCNVMCSFGQMTNPFVKENRQYPVDFGCPLKDYHILNIEIPEGYEVISLPESVKVSLEDQAAAFKFMISREGRKITVTSMVLINRPIFTAAEYDKLREFFMQIVAKHAQQIVLKKI